MIIGQKRNIEEIQLFKEKDAFPRFMIITGEKGSGKKTFARYVSEQIGGFVVYPENGVDAVREAIASAHKCTAPTTYIFADADRMSPQAKNALLKVTEESPQQAYFIMTLEDINNALSTLKSRAFVFQMENYTTSELQKYLSMKSDGSKDDTILLIAQNPGQIDELLQMNVDEFINYCNLFLDNIATVSGVNAFKSASRIKFTEQGEGYDPILFLNCCMAICYSRMRHNIDSLSSSDVMKLFKTIRCCVKYKNELKVTGIKKDATFDMFILELRDILRQEG